jgi:hypothetical protein
MCSVGGKPIEEKVMDLVAWIGERRETESLESIDKAILRVVSESSGRNDRKNVEKVDESNFRYVFHQPTDKNREVILSVLAFSIPRPEPKPK